MIIEMRTYQLKPGTNAAFEERFAEGLTARLQFSRLGALWHSEVGALNQVVHVWPYESYAEKERIAQEARKTGKWPPKTHEFIITQETKLLQPAPFSPSLEERKLGNLYEIRIYTYQPGTMPTVLERFGQVIPDRVKLSPLAGAWYSAVGSLNQFIQVWAYRDAGERERVRAEVGKQVKGWPPQTREFMVKQENMLVIPAACSPLH